MTGTPVLDGTPHPEADVDASDTAQVLVIKPALTLTKSVSDDLVRPGDPVTYTYRVTNTGDVGLQLIDGGDDICAPITFVGGDTNHNGLVDGANSGAAETWTFTCPQIVDAPVTNHARVVGVDPLGNHYEATAQASVDVLLSGDRPGQVGQRRPRPGRDAGDVHVHGDEHRRRARSRPTTCCRT